MRIVYQYININKGQGIREKTKVDFDTEDQFLSNFNVDPNFVLWVEFGYIFSNWFELIEMVELLEFNKDNMNSVSK